MDKDCGCETSQERENEDMKKIQTENLLGFIKNIKKKPNIPSTISEDPIEKEKEDTEEEKTEREQLDEEQTRRLKNILEKIEDLKR